MDPYSGRVYQLGTDLAGDPPIGASFPLDELRANIQTLEREPTSDEVAATHARALMRVTEDVAQIAHVGQRELERRKRRRHAEKAARKRNRS